METESDRELLKKLRNPNYKTEKIKVSHKRDKEDRPKRFAGQSGEDGNTSLRTKKILLNLSPEEYSIISYYYEKSSNKTMGSFVRQKILSEPGAIQNNNKVANEIVSFSFQLQKIGNNINQIARILNSRKDADPTLKLISELQSELDELQFIKKQFCKTIKKGNL